MSDFLTRAAFLQDIENRQDSVLAALDELNEKVEQSLGAAARDFASTTPTPIDQIYRLEINASQHGGNQSHFGQNAPKKAA